MNSAKRVRLTKYFGFCVLAAAIFLLPGAARAVDVSVDCDASGSINAALAPLDLQGPHTITVTGTCVENVGIFDRERVTIQAPEGQTATINPGGGVVVLVSRSHNINLNRLVITGGFFGMILEEGSQVVMESTTIANNARAGVTVFAESTLALSSSSVRDNGRNGIVVVAGSGLELNGNVTVESNGQSGVHILDSSWAGIFGNIIQNNGAFGVFVFHMANLLLVDNTIVGNGATGVRVSETSHGELRGNTIRNNGAAEPSSPGGLMLTEQGEAFIEGGNDISNNTGPGVLVTANSTLSSLGGNTITNNTAGGVSLLRQSLGQFFAADTISGNGGANFACDTTSQAAGDLTGVTKIRCMRIERELGPPRPGRILDFPYHRGRGRRP